MYTNTDSKLAHACNPTLNYKLAHFLTSAAKLSQCPNDSGAEVAFAGRSNAGKSSALNTLTGQTKLARTSKTPGRTQLINFFGLKDPTLRLVDLPGYGYAKVPESVKRSWQQHLEAYLEQRQCLKALVLVMDIRHPLTEYDRRLCQWAQNAQLPIHLLLTKADKLKRGPQKQAIFQVIRDTAWLGDLVSTQAFSALNKTGVESLENFLNHHLQNDASVSESPTDDPSKTDPTNEDLTQ